MSAHLLLVVACILAWCLLLASVCTALVLWEEIIDEVERDLPFDRRPSLISWNGKAVALAAYKKHAALFPDSKLRFRHNMAVILAALSLFTTLFLCSRALSL